MSNVAELLGANAEYLLRHICKTIPKEALHLPGPDFVDRILLRPTVTTGYWSTYSACSVAVGLAGTGFLEHPAGRPRASSIPAAPASPRTRCTSIQKISSSSRSRAAATR